MQPHPPARKAVLLLIDLLHASTVYNFSFVLMERRKKKVSML